MSTFLQFLLPYLAVFLIGLAIAWAIWGSRPGNA